MRARPSALQLLPHTLSATSASGKRPIQNKHLPSTPATINRAATALCFIQAPAAASVASMAGLCPYKLRAGQARAQAQAWQHAALHLRRMGSASE